MIAKELVRDDQKIFLEESGSVNAEGYDLMCFWNSLRIYACMLL